MSDWPEIPYPAWRETCGALHLYAQIVGKYRLAHTPWINHSWHATLYPTPRGLTTGLVHDPKAPTSASFDFVDGSVVVEAMGGAREGFALEPMSVAQFYERFCAAVRAVGGKPDIHGAPNEVQDAVPFRQDRDERSWDAAAVRSFHRALVTIAGVFERSRSAFIGKVSPVHLFWGSFDLAVTRFSGRPAPLHPGGFPSLPDDVTREAYSHEVASAGFWPGGNGVDEAMFYAYAYPAPQGFGDGPITPAAARYDDALGEFLLPYAAVARSGDPDGDLIGFIEAAYRAAADRAGWDREALECPLGVPRRPRPVG